MGGTGQTDSGQVRTGVGALSVFPHGRLVLIRKTRNIKYNVPYFHFAYLEMSKHVTMLHQQERIMTS